MKLLFDDVCASCPLAERRQGMMPVNPQWHSEPLKYLFIGENPREEEERAGRPFMGAPGKLLKDCIKKAGISEKECLFSTSCWCAPKDDVGKIYAPKEDEYTHCIPHSMVLIRRYKPRLVVAVGKIPMFALMKPKADWKATKQHGKFMEMKVTPRERYLVYRSWVQDMEEYLEGDTFTVLHEKEEDQVKQIEHAKEKGYSEAWMKTPVMPVVHPAYCVKTGRSGKWTESIQFDLQLASVKVDESAIQKRVDKNYFWINDEKEALDHLDMLIQKFEGGEITEVACDVETSEELGVAGKVGLIPLSPINRLLTIQLTHENNQGATFMINHRESVFNDPLKFAALRNKFVEFFEKVDVVGHNFSFDAKTIRCRLGIKKFRLIGDTMLMFHWLAAGKGLGLGLDDLGARLLGTGLHKNESKEWREKNPDLTFEEMPLSLSLDYASGDTDVTFQAYHQLKVSIEEEGRWQQYFDHMHGKHAVWDVIVDLEWYGMSIDKSVLDFLAEEYPKRIETSLREIHHNPFVRAYLEDKRKAYNQNIREENQAKKELNEEIKKQRDWIDAERKEGRKPVGEDGKPLRKTPFKKMKPEIPDLNVWVEDRKKWFNPKSSQQVQELWKETVKFPWENIVGIEYGDIDPKKGRYSKKKVGEKPKTNAHNREVLIGWAAGQVLRCEKHKQEQGVKYYECVKGMLEGVEKLRRLSKNYGSYVDGIYKLVIDPVEPDQVWDPKERCFPLYKPYSDFPPPWCLHPSFHLAGTETGRLSSSDPNGQAFPKKLIDRESNVKLPYVSRWHDTGGILIQPDFSQLEVRVLVMFAEEEQMAEAINSGEDVHRFVAGLVNSCRPDQVTKEQRAAAKAVTFGIVYGQGIPNMAQALGITMDEAQKIQDKVFARVPKLKAYIDGRHKEVRETGRVSNPMGRICYLPHIESDFQGEVNKALRNSVNAPIQGAGSDLCAQSYGRAWKTIKRHEIPAVPFSVIHDSQTFDAAPGSFWDVIEVQYYEMVWAQYNYYDWMTVKPEIDFDIGVSFGRLVTADLVWEDDRINYDHNRLVLSGYQEDIELLVQAIEKGGQQVVMEHDGPHPQKEEAEAGKWQSKIFVRRPEFIVKCVDKRLVTRENG